MITDRSTDHLPAPQVDILVVDDLPEKLLVYRTILEGLDLNMVVARSGHEALKAVLQREFAVILLDVNMPDMDGFETATLIRQRKRSAATPIIFLTAFTDEMRITQGYASGAVDYIPTPVVPEILRAKVQVFTELFEMRRAAAMQAEERARRKAAEEAAERSAFLAAAGDVLTRSIAFEPMLQAVVGVAIPFLADVSVFCLADEHGAPTRMLCAWKQRGTSAGPDRSTTCPHPLLREALERALTTEQFRLLSPLPPAPDADPQAPSLSGGAAIVMPLSLRGRMHGSIALVRLPAGETGAGDARSYSPNDVALAQELADRISIGLENARLVQDIQEADQRKDEFLGMLAHELRNPLAPMRNAVYLLDLQEPRDELVEQARDVIDRQVTHMTRLVDDLLDATRIARGKILLRIERCDLANIVRQTTEDYASLFRAAGIRLKAEVPEAPVHAVGDPTRLAQVVGNLLHNAHKFTNKGGSVLVQLLTDGEGAFCTLRVKDDGIGIGPDVMPHVFDMFRQAEQGLDRSRGGLGLGLTLVKGLVEMHGGSVRASSEGVERGAEFIIHLPLAHDGRAVPQQGMPAGTTVHHHRMVIIDSDREAAEDLRLLLTQEQQHATTAFTGATGLEMVWRTRADVVLCALDMPGMDGYDVARALRNDPSGKPVLLVALNASEDEASQMKAPLAGFDLCLAKPLDPAAVRAVLARIPDMQPASWPSSRTA